LLSPCWWAIFYLPIPSHPRRGISFQGGERKAIDHLKTALETTSPFDWHDQLFWIHCSLAPLFFEGHDFDDARAHIEQAKSHAAEDRYKMGRAMELQAIIWYRQCRPEDANFEVLGALEIFENLGEAKEEERCRDLLRVIEAATGSEYTGF
jgi:hypothetical protein